MEDAEPPTQVAPSESQRSTASARGAARALSAKERVKLELQQRAKRQQAGGRGSRNEAKDREKRKLHASVKKEASGTSGW